MVAICLDFHPSFTMETRKKIINLSTDKCLHTHSLSSTNMEGKNNW